MRGCVVQEGDAGGQGRRAALGGGRRLRAVAALRTSMRVSRCRRIDAFRRCCVARRRRCLLNDACQRMTWGWMVCSKLGPPSRQLPAPRPTRPSASRDAIFSGEKICQVLN